MIKFHKSQKIKGPMMKLIFYLCSICLFFNCSAKIIIFTYSYNRPDFIEIQFKTFKKFLKDDYEFIIINDAPEPGMAQDINDICQAYNLKCITVPQEIHDRPYLHRLNRGPYFIIDSQSPCVRNCNVVQYSLDQIGFHHNDIVALFDSDLFLIREFSITDYLKDYDLAGFNRAIEYTYPRNTRDFLWIGLIFLDIPRMQNKMAFNVNCGVIYGIGADSGGYTNYYLSQGKVKYLNRIRIDPFICEKCTAEKNYRCYHNTEVLKKNGFAKNDIQLIQNTPIDWGSGSKELGMHQGRNLEFFLNNTFVHYRGASNYAHLSANNINMEQFHRDKTKAFEDYLKIILD